uniref:Uncharacterized protein n=1 Tax=Glossina palpalis gambiensis TaxID=67801 RepID=A0A1B0APD7_9MUSC
MSNGYAANKPIYMNFDSVDVFKSNSIPFASWANGSINTLCMASCTGSCLKRHNFANSTVAKCTFVLVRDLRERIPERIPLAEKLHFTLKMRALRACFLRIERREDAHNGNQIPVRYV